ncbi:hypothetical protein PA598K_05748 [Paenibacillus sp. 598K]|uniref:CdaR family transcriptional regulator n=1 Tax=Paenibacillus sp. 598K TaxID=1117987 RepID=UPI000FF9DE4E|nr:sugar diacid recognition domain-containing protein [Paenibacillus sp. 598K]GBF77213.1 hypothetical protein PA598K_05748 [Paenibacillus sp. 598K]
MADYDRISEALALRIVEAAKEVIRHEVNFIRTDGIIVASTTPERIGTRHAAALEALALGEIVEVDATTLYEGSRPGINCPVIVDGEPLGVIGIAGDARECRPLANLLTKIAELLIREQRLSETRQSADDERHAAVRRLLFGEGRDAASLSELLERYGLPMQGQACVLVVALRSEVETRGVVGDGEARSERAQMRESTVRSAAPWMDGLLAAAKTPLYAYLFPDRYAILLPEDGYEGMLRHLRELAAGYGLQAGIGSLQPWGELSLSYRHAQLALQQARNDESAVCEFRKLGLDLLLSQLPQAQRRDYAEQRLGALNAEERDTLRVYQAHGLSLKAAAEALFLHKNTLQYRLDKISRKTGLDPRRYVDSVELYIALLLDGTRSD